MDKDGGWKFGWWSVQQFSSDESAVRENKDLWISEIEDQLGSLQAGVCLWESLTEKGGRECYVFSLGE